MSERSITIHVKDDINLAKMMSAIFIEYEPSIEKISKIGTDRVVLSAPKPPDSVTYEQVKTAIKNTFSKLK